MDADYRLPIEEQAFRALDSISANSVVDNQPIPLPDSPSSMPFNMNLLPDALRPWIEDMSDIMQCPPDFFAIPAMVAASAIVGGKIGIRPKQFTAWTVIPNLWGFVIGRPGVMKSPAMNQALGPIRRIEEGLRKEHHLRMREFNKQHRQYALREKAALKAATKALEENPGSTVDLPEAPESPTMHRLITNDCNVASLGELARQNPNGILVVHDEIVGSYFNRLERSENSEERSLFLTGWTGNITHTADRMGRGLNLHIPSLTLSVIGGTQPARIAEYLRHAVKGSTFDDGMIQRFSLIAWPDDSSEWKNVDRCPNEHARTRAYEVFDYLHRIEPDDIGAQRDELDPTPYLQFAPDALAVFTDWHTALQNRLKHDSLHCAMESHLSKYRKSISALALVIHLLDGGIGSVSTTAVMRALDWAKYLESHAARAYSSATTTAVPAARQILARLARLPNPFTPRELDRRKWSGLDHPGAIRNALEVLVDHRYLFAENVETGGRPSLVYHINPILRA